MVVFYVNRYAVREVKKWRYAVRKAKIGRYAVRKWEGGVTLEGDTPPLLVRSIQVGFRPYAVRKGPVRSTQQFR